MLLRVRSNVGLWRIDGLDESTATVSDVLEGIACTRPHVVYQKPLSLDPACEQTIDAVLTLAEQGLRHGSMIHCRVDPASCVDVATATTTTATAEATAEATAQAEAAAAQTATTAAAATGAGSNMRRVIDKDGSIKLVPSSDVRAPEQDRGFRKGMLPLRDMKMQWTLSDFVALDSQFEFKIKRQESAICKQVSLDVPSISNFQAYLQRFQFQRKRFGYLYGRFVVPTDDDKDEDKKDDDKDTKMSYADDSKDDKEEKKPTKVWVEAIYEPPQEVDQEAAEGFIPLDNEEEEARVDRITNLLGLTKVGWVYGHEARPKGQVMTAAEVIMTAEFQLEAAGGVEETPFVTVKVAPAPLPDNNNDTTPTAPVSVEAFQVSQQCMAMVAEEALEIGTDPTVCVVNETFTAIQEGKQSSTVENSFFLTVVPIAQHTSDRFVSDFPRLHRDLDDTTPSHDALKRQLSKAGTAGWTFEDLMTDLNLLLYLDKFMDAADMEKICTAIHDQRPIEDGYKLLIKSMAGIDGAY